MKQRIMLAPEFLLELIKRSGLFGVPNSANAIRCGVDGDGAIFLLIEVTEEAGE
jgi:hypothetical protein